MVTTLATFPDFPAEIRAPAGATFGVSAFQIYFGSEDVSTAGDDVDVLVAMNPAALITNLKDVLPGGLLVIDTDAFTDKNLARAGYASNPVEDGSLDAYRVIPIAVSKQVVEAVKPFGLSHKFAVRCKNMWTLGLVMWLFDRDRTITVDNLKKKFANKPEIADANVAALNAGSRLCRDRRAADGCRGLQSSEGGGRTRSLQKHHWFRVACLRIDRRRPAS